MPPKTKSPHILLVDNYDSFAHNLARYCELAGATISILRNDKITAETARKMAVDGLVISPGPGAPADAGNSLALITQLGAQLPILGVCLGHQCIGQAYGGITIRAEQPTHGRSSTILHNQNDPLFTNIPSPFEAGRYHSLICDFAKAPELDIIAREQKTNLPMAIKHRTHPVYGVQFHPESILTPHGQTLIQNFVNYVIGWTP